MAGSTDGARPRLGVVGAGKVGTVLARLAAAAGYEVSISSSGSRERISMIIELLAPGAIARTTAEVIENADVVILALPLGRFGELPFDAFSGTIVVDAMNHWWEIDGPRDGILPDDQSTSGYVQERVGPAAPVVKAFSHMGYHDLDAGPRPVGAVDRKGIALAGDDAVAIAVVATLIDDLGFDPVELGPLEAGVQLEVGSPLFGANLPAVEIRSLVGVV